MGWQSVTRTPVCVCVWVGGCVTQDAGVPEPVARGCLRWMAEAGSDATAATVALCVRSVCVQYARGLLAEAPRIKQAEFLTRWKQAVPSAMTVSMDMLRGEVRRGFGVHPRLGCALWWARVSCRVSTWARVVAHALRLFP